MGGQNWSNLSCGRQPWGAPAMILSPGTHAFVQSPPVRVGWTGDPLLINRMWRKWWDMLPAEASERLWVPPCCCSLVLASACSDAGRLSRFVLPCEESHMVKSWGWPRANSHKELRSPVQQSMESNPDNSHGASAKATPASAKSPNERCPGWRCGSGRPAMSPGCRRHRSVCCFSRVSFGAIGYIALDKSIPPPWILTFKKYPP